MAREGVTIEEIEAAERQETEPPRQGALFPQHLVEAQPMPNPAAKNKQP